MLWRGTLPWGETFRAPAPGGSILTHDNQVRCRFLASAPNAQTTLCSCSNPVAHWLPPPHQAMFHKLQHCCRTNNACWPFAKLPEHRSLRRSFGVTSACQSWLRTDPHAGRFDPVFRLIASCSPPREQGCLSVRIGVGPLRRFDLDQCFWRIGEAAVRVELSPRKTEKLEPHTSFR